MKRLTYASGLAVGIIYLNNSQVGRGAPAEYNYTVDSDTTIQFTMNATTSSAIMITSS